MKNETWIYSFVMNVAGETLFKIAVENVLLNIIFELYIWYRETVIPVNFRHFTRISQIPNNF